MRFSNNKTNNKTINKTIKKIYIKNARWWRLAIVGAVACAAVALLVACQTTGAVVDETPIPFDPEVRLGRLDNGLTYYIRHNETPSQQADLTLVVNAGSVLERDDQLGLAHFVEHMAFNGTTDYPGNRVVEVLEELGISFGAHANAYTSFDETVYFLDVPTDDPEKLRTGLNVLAQWAHAVTFDPEEIEKERGVVLEERRLSLGADSRIRDEQLPVLLRGSRYADRLPIGDPDIIENFEYDTLIDFYRTWYRPDLMAVIAVGDFDVDSMEAQINQFFGSIPAADQPTPRPKIRDSTPIRLTPQYRLRSGGAGDKRPDIQSARG